MNIVVAISMWEQKFSWILFGIDENARLWFCKDLRKVYKDLKTEVISVFPL